MAVEGVLLPQDPRVGECLGIPLNFLLVLVPYVGEVWVRDSLLLGGQLYSCWGWLPCYLLF